MTCEASICVPLSILDGQDSRNKHKMNSNLHVNNKRSYLHVCILPQSLSQASIYLYNNIQL